MLYENLPGIDLTIKDGNIILPAENFGTNTVLIIAPTDRKITAADKDEDGRIDQTFKLIQSSEDFAKNKLGSFSESNPMARKWKQVYDAGCRSIYVIELDNTITSVSEQYVELHTIYSNLEDSTFADIILLDGVYADSDFASATIDLSGEAREDFIVDAKLGTVKTQNFTALGEDLVLDDEPIDGSIVVKKGDTVLSLTVGYTYDSTTKTVSLVTPLVAEETATVSYKVYEYNFARQLAAFCSIVSAKNTQIIGVISMTPNESLKSNDLSGIKAYIENQTMQQYNQYLQVVGGALYYFEIANTPYIDTLAGVYAGTISILPSYSSPTNKAVPGVLFPVFNLSQSQLQAITNKHIVTGRSKNNKIVFGDAVTTAADNSDFVRLTSLRIVNDAVNLIREIADPYIGEPNTLARRNALDTAIRSGLNNMIKRGALNDFRFSIKSTLADQIKGDMIITLDLVPVFETRRILATIALKPMLD